MDSWNQNISQCVERLTHAVASRKPRLNGLEIATGHLAAAARTLGSGDTNCMIEGNAPLALERTDGWHRSLEVWDRMYRRKAALCPVFLACRPLFCELHDPPVVTEATMISSFGHVPATRTPPVVSLASVERLMAAIGLNIRLLVWP